MSKKDDSKQFLSMADSFIDLANSHCNEVDNAEVNASFLFGAARFSAFITASSMGNKETYEADIPEAIDFYADQFKRMLEEHFEQYKSVFKEAAPRYQHLVKKTDE